MTAISLFLLVTVYRRFHHLHVSLSSWVETRTKGAAVKYSRTIVWALIMLICAPQAFAHRSGCHTWRTCPSDRGTYASPATRNVTAAEGSSVASSPKAAQGYELVGRVIGVADGDTIVTGHAKIPTYGH